MKKWKIINIILFIIAILISLYYLPLRVCKNLSSENIEYIQVKDTNNNKSFLIKNKKDIDYILNNLNNRVYKKNGLSLNLNQKGIILTFNDGNKDIEKINLYSETIIKKYPFLYYSLINNEEYLYKYLIDLENEFDLFRDYSFLYVDEIIYKEEKINYSIDDLNQIYDFFLFIRSQNYKEIEEDINIDDFNFMTIKTYNKNYYLKFKDNYVYFNKKLYKFEKNIEKKLINIIKKDNYLDLKDIFNLQIRLNNVTNEKINFIIYNKDMNDCFFESSNYTIEKYDIKNNIWTECKTINNKLYQTFVRFYEDKISYIWEFNKKYGNLDNGTYRLNFNILSINKTKKEDYCIYFKI